jgi:hypothetical protein
MELFDMELEKAAALIEAAGRLRDDSPLSKPTSSAACSEPGPEGNSESGLQNVIPSPVPPQWRRKAKAA